MNLFLLSLGTRGDIALFVTLGREMTRRGHRVVLGTSGFYASQVAAAGIEWRQVGTGTHSQLLALLRALSAEADKTRRTRLYYQHWLQPQLADFRSQGTALAAQAEYFISNVKLVLERAGQVIPGAAVTYDPPLNVADLARYGSHGGRILDLVAMSRLLVDPQGTWGGHYHFTGFWRAPTSTVTVDPELAAFVDAGPPPIVITLGSMLMFDDAKLTRDLTAALRLAGQRGVLVQGWARSLAAQADRDILCCVPEAPYDWLFARAACVVHHGGCGTLAAVLGAGKPSILLPQIACQEHFGNMLARQGLTAGVFDVDRLAPDDLARALRRTVEDESLRASARRWQAVVEEEPGVRGAADLIEKHWTDLNIKR